MNIDLKKEQKKLCLAVDGRLDTATAPQLDDAIKQNIADAELVELDFSSLEYISSAGLRVLLGAKKAVGANGRVVVKNANAVISEVFEITGFNDIIDVE